MTPTPDETDLDPEDDEDVLDPIDVLDWFPEEDELEAVASRSTN